MRRVMNSVIFSAFLAGAALVGPPPAAYAAGRDGNWSVLIITEKGECDRAYRYEVKVANGQVSYRGDSVDRLAGRVAPDGAIKVSIKLGDKGASGTGHLSAAPAPAAGAGSAPAAPAPAVGKRSGE